MTELENYTIDQLVFALYAVSDKIRKDKSEEINVGTLIQKIMKIFDDLELKEIIEDHLKHRHIDQEQILKHNREGCMNITNREHVVKQISDFYMKIHWTRRYVYHRP